MSGSRTLVNSPARRFPYAQPTIIMNTRRTRRERNALRDLGWQLHLDRYQPPDPDLVDLAVPGTASEMMILEPHRDATAYVKSTLSHDIEDCR